MALVDDPCAASFLQDVHSAFDVAGAALGSQALAASLFTDYRLSLFKLIPVEAHEVLDYVDGLASIAAPFALGFAKQALLRSTRCK
jgi:hypothetical protein